MPKSAPSAPDVTEIVNSLLAPAPRSAPGIDERLALLAAHRSEPATSAALDRKLLGRLHSQHRSLEQAMEMHGHLKGVLDKLSATPWHPAVYLGHVDSAQGPRAVVHHRNGERLVRWAEGVDAAKLQVGDTVYLSKELNVIMAHGTAAPRCGEVCAFERWTPDGRLVVKARGDEEYVLRSSAALAGTTLKPGTRLRWDREAMVAFERIEKESTSPFFVEKTPVETFADIGGLGKQVARITDALSLHFAHADIARRYGLPPVGSILLHGPAGTGKTLVAKAMANWFAGKSPSGQSFFLSVPPGATGSMWHSESERNIRELFRVASETAAAHPGARVLIFFDELDSIGATRGASHMRVQDNVLTALLAELDGFKARSGVVVIGATNRRESLDPALLRPGRFGDLEIEIPRPGRQATREIFAKHLGAGIPYARNGHGEDFAATREEIIEAAVSRIFAPNGGQELATLTFRDGKRRPVHAAHLISGALIASIARDAIERACRREYQSAGTGVEWQDVALAIESRFDSAGRILTPQNCRQHLSDLPHDLDVVNVEPVRRKVPKGQRFLNPS